MKQDATLQSDKDVAKELFTLIKQDTNEVVNSSRTNDFKILRGDSCLTKEKFEMMNLPENLLKSIYAAGYDKPSKIQQAAIPHIQNEFDLAFQSQSGTGKTVAFTVGMLCKIKQGCGPQAVILSPTRELNTQIYNEIKKFTDFLKIKCYLALVDRKLENIDHEIILGSPGSILTLFIRKKINPDNIKIMVLDETDVLLDKSTMGAQSFRLLKILEKTQKIYISATYNEDVNRVIEAYSPKCTLLLEDKNTKPDQIRLYHLDIEFRNRLNALKIIYEVLTVAQVIVFVNTKKTVKYLQQVLEEDLNSVSILHGDLTVEERDLAVENFKTSKSKILITTDVFSRGMDIPQVNLIINYELPYFKDKMQVDTYTHRIGRSGRFGRVGFVIDMICGEIQLKEYILCQEALASISKKFTVDALIEACDN